MKKILLVFTIALCIFILLCFIPFNISKFIPMLEAQIESEYGLTVNMDKLTLKILPSITLKASQCDVKYNKKEKVAVLNGIKIKIALLPLFNHKIIIKDLRVDDADILLKFKNNKFLITDYISLVDDLEMVSKIRLKKYIFRLIDSNNQEYSFIGTEFMFSDFISDKSLKISSRGELLIDNVKNINYDVSLFFKDVVLSKYKNIYFEDFFNLMKKVEANADVVADLKIKNCKGDIITDGTLTFDKLSLVSNGIRLPESFAHFIMLGNKVSVSSLLYTNLEDKIVVNGYFIHSENPSFNLAVKSDNINLNDAFYFARLYSDIANLEQIKTIDGYFNANFVLKGSLKKIKSNGCLKISDVSLSTQNIDVKKFNSNIDFSDNKIIIKSAKAIVNSAPVIINGEVVSNKINLNFLIDKFRLKNISLGEAKLNSAIISIIANVSGQFNNLTPKIEAELTDISAKYKLINGRGNKIVFKSDDKNSGNFSLFDLVINSKYSTPIYVPSIKAKLVGSDIILDTFNLFSGDTKLTAWGKILNYDNEKLTFAFLSNGYCNIGNIFNIKQFDSVFPTYIEFSGDKDIQSVNAQLLQQNSSAQLSIPQSVIFNLSAKCINNEIKISDCSINSFSGEFTQNLKKNIANTSKLLILTGTVENIDNPILKNIKVNILKTLPINFVHYSAKLNGNVVLNGKIKNPEIVGNIKFPIFTDKYGCLTAKNIVLSFTKNIVNFNCCNTKIFNSIFSLVGSADTNLHNGLNIKNLNIKSKELDFDNLSLFLMMPKTMNIVVNNGSLFAENFIIQTPIKSLLLTDLNAGFYLKNNILNIRDISANIYNGVVAGYIDLNMLDSNYKGLIQGRGISSIPIIKNLTNIKENISGKLDFDMSLNSSLKSKFLKQANIKFIIHDGQMSTLGKVEHLLYAQNIIADNMLKTSIAVVGRAISAKDTGLFKYLNGILLINNDVVNIQSMKMMGPNMSMYITGNYGLMSDIANVTILGRLSNTIVSSLGSFGTFTMNKFKIALIGESNEESRILSRGLENIPMLPQRNTKEFKSFISGHLEEKSSVKSFMWISETEKEYKTKEVPFSNVAIPKFIENLPY